MCQVLKKMDLPFDKIVLETTLDGGPYLFKKNESYITGTRNNLVGENILRVFNETDYNFLNFVLNEIDLYYEYDKFIPEFDLKAGPYPSFREIYKQETNLSILMHNIISSNPRNFPIHLKTL